MKYTVTLRSFAQWSNSMLTSVLQHKINVLLGSRLQRPNLSLCPYLIKQISTTMLTFHCSCIPLGLVSSSKALLLIIPCLEVEPQCTNCIHSCPAIILYSCSACIFIMNKNKVYTVWRTSVSSGV